MGKYIEKYIDLRFKRKLKNNKGITFIKIRIPYFFHPLTLLFLDVNGKKISIRVDRGKQVNIDHRMQGVTEEQDKFLYEIMPVVLSYLPRVKLSY